MLQQAFDFQDECAAIHAMLAPLSDAQLGMPTAFKAWTFEDILRHLHMWNWAADKALADPEGFLAFRSDVGRFVASGDGFRSFERSWCGDLHGRALVDAWKGFADEMSARFSVADPGQRVAWVGPEMSVRSSITARLMETWAHAQAMYDALGLERQDADRLRNIAVLGVNTYKWTFANRRWPVPDPQPFVVLHSPSGEAWTFGDENSLERIEGAATAFCQVVTQTRNVADVDLQVTGTNAALWMANAQCFAGPPHQPPAPGTRKRAAGAEILR